MMRPCLLLALLGLAILPGGSQTAPRGRPLPVKQIRYRWRHVRIGGGGFVDGVYFSRRQAGLMYARTDVGGAYRWSARRQRWLSITDWLGPAGDNFTGIEALALDPRDARRVYLAAGLYTFARSPQGAILRSADQGRSWKISRVPFKLGGNEDGRFDGNRLAVDPRQDRILFYGTRDRGLWRSPDFGASWRPVSGFPSIPASRRARPRFPGFRPVRIGIAFVLFAPKSGRRGSPARRIFVGVSNPRMGIYASRDAGKHWRRLRGQPKGLRVNHGALSRAGVLYLTYGDAPGPNGMTRGAVWRYDPGNRQWRDITPIHPGGSRGSFGYGGLALDPRHAGTVMVTTMDRWAGGDAIFRSADSGAHWRNLAPGAGWDASQAPWLRWIGLAWPPAHARLPLHPGIASTGWMGAIAIDPFHAGHVLYGTGWGLWASRDVTAADRGGRTHWVFSDRGLEETVPLALISPPAGAHLVSGLGDLDGFRHASLATSPRQGTFSSPYFQNTSSLDFAGQRPEFIVRAGSSGWPHATFGAYSEDGGRSWHAFARRPAGSRGSGTIAVSADAAAIVWTPRPAWHPGMAFLRGGKTYVSLDHGRSWQLSRGLPPAARAVSDREDARRFYALAGRTGAVYASRNRGRSFRLVSRPVSAARGFNFPQLAAAPGRAGDLWIATPAGLWHSADGGRHFTRLAEVEKAFQLGFGKAAPGHRYPAIYLFGEIGRETAVFRSGDAGKSWARINDRQHQYGRFHVVCGDPRIYGRVYLGTDGRGIVYGDPAR